jgi:hypothetical protein
MQEEHQFHSPYNIIVPTIVQSIEAGLVCFLNPDTMEVELIAGDRYGYPEAFSTKTGISSNGEPFKHLLWKNSLMFSPVPEEELYRLMQDFVQNLTDNRVSNKLAVLMKKKSPYAKVNAVIHKSKHSADWAEYRVKHIENLVRQRLIILLNERPPELNEDGESLYRKISGFFNSPLLPLPSLCLSCRHKDSSVPEIMCHCQFMHQNRHKEDSFVCERFEEL